MVRQTQFKDKKKDYEDMPLWKLGYKLADKDKRIIALIKQGETRSESSLKKAIIRRNWIRKILLEKLILWNEGKITEKMPTFEELQEKDKEFVG